MRSLGARWTRAAASGQFFTRWSWLVTLPFAVTLMGGYDDARSTQERVAGVGIALAVHLALGVLGVLAAAGERAAQSPRVRIGIVVTGLAVIAVGRPFLLAAGAHAAGVQLFAGPLGARVATNVVVVAAALSLVAMMTLTVRTHRAVIGRLRLVLEALEVQRSRDAGDVAVLSDRVLEATRRTLLAALPPVVAGPIEPERAALLLKGFADEVVRPLSHRLFDDADRVVQPREQELPPGPTGAVPRLFPARIDRPAPVWITVVAYALLWVPHLAAQTSLATAGIAFVAVVVVGACGNGLVVTAGTRAASGSGAGSVTLLPVFAGGYLLVGAAIGVAAGVSAAAGGAPVEASAVATAVLVSVVVYPVFALLVAAVGSGFRRLATVEGELATAIDEAAVLAAASHNAATVARRRVAHLLHGDVQAECVAAARDLRRVEVVTEADWVAALDRIESALDLPRGEPDPGGARRSVETMIEAWRFSLDITLTADEAAWAVLDTDASRLELAVDSLAEGLTNTIRHGTESRAEVTLTAAATGAGVVVEVLSQGRIDRRADHDGYGLAQLAGRARALTLTQSGSVVRLRVELT
ncbi:MAG: hypothetical protein EPO52_02600 [Herbiconiux sp.]|uniref:hypothetical protein n=1 Tax=Herbiconiux sp. TaxID=1871186 RepID=UPI001226F479|nr:hypothetical protein [Herbiconiux sp.]TAJ49848.1 MAG: hypothetical protein EPO52_02600 [Herbiconiux sp.]